MTNPKKISILGKANIISRGFSRENAEGNVSERKGTMERNAKRIAGLLKLLANENRLLILCALRKGPRTVSGLGENIPNITQSALSQHLALLRAQGVLEGSKAGQSVTYSISDHRVEEILSVLGKHYCDL